MKAKKAVFNFLLATVIFVGFNSASWFFYVSKIYSDYDGNHPGDLGRKSYLVDSLYYKTSGTDLPKRHYEQKIDTHVDVLTIGDSFTNGGAGGKNQYYQDYIASNADLNVLNIHRLPGLNSFETLLSLYNNGVLDELKPKSIIIEAVERAVVERFAKPMNWELKTDIKISDFKVVDSKRKKNRMNVEPPPKKKKTFDVKIINNSNFNAVLYNFLYHFNDHAFYNSVYKTLLDRDFFSVKAPRQLLFYDEAIEKIKQSNEKSIALINNNFNQLQKILAKKNIKLYFMPVVTKYNLYSKYIVNNPYPKSVFFELLRPLPKQYTFIDTKQILGAALEEGMQDVFYADDTHWSYLASEKIFSNMDLVNSFFK